MEPFLLGYHVTDPTWFYLSFLLIVAVFFKFSRLWSVRNLDLALLLLISPGLLFLSEEPGAGYVWLFVASGFLLGRVLLDGLFTRRPRLEQNMNAAGMTFLLAAAFAFLMTKVMTESPPQAAVDSVRRANQMLQRQPEPALPAQTDGAAAGPGVPLVVAPVAGISSVVAPPNLPGAVGRYESDVIAARSIAILAHLAVILGLIFVGRQIFADVEMGLAMATIYLLLPCTAIDVGKVNHVLPAALIVWAVCAYRQPLISGALLGLACGTLFFPVFLLPLWAAFYGRRGAIRFGAAVTVVTAIMVASLLLTSADTQAFVRQTLGCVEWARLQFRDVPGASAGFWSDHESAYRVPVFVSFLVLLIALTMWPRRKSVTHLIAHSTAIVIGTQFWYPQQGGVFVLWYLPLLLVVVFRPALANHFAPELKPLPWLRAWNSRAEPKPELVATASTRLV